MLSTVKIALVVCTKEYNTMKDNKDCVIKEVSTRYCQRHIESDSHCDKQCNHCNEYFLPIEALKTERVILTWQCEICNDTQLSDSTRTHHPDYCKCGKSGIDLEEHYQRGWGEIKEVKRVIIEE